MFSVSDERGAGSSPAKQEVGRGKYDGHGDEHDCQADEPGHRPLGGEVAGALGTSSCVEVYFEAAVAARRAVQRNVSPSTGGYI